MPKLDEVGAPACSRDADMAALRLAMPPIRFRRHHGHASMDHATQPPRRGGPQAAETVRGESSRVCFREAGCPLDMGKAMMYTLNHA